MAELDALTTAWKSRGLSPEDIHEREDGTIAATERTLAAPDPDASPRRLVVGEEVALQEVIGRGGMGVVRSAHQPSVRREVAVKHLGEEADPRAFRSLLKEAWVGGSLEHPNIVPVHTLAPHDQGVAVVMKRVEGRSWSSVLRDDADPGPDPLGAHLRTFVQVCNAVDFAHSQGVLHLDLKPANVMLGAFGEVYVVDWGLAAGVDGAPAWLPPASEIRSIAGTPDYMAPELALGAGERIDERTDVYLLTAVLHEIVTGRPPHRGESVMVRLFQAYQSEPVTLDDANEELLAILHRGMHVDPEQRFASVRELREAVEVFASHREADELIRDADREITELEASLADDATETDVQREFGGARFALRAAREARPDHPALPELHRRLYEPMVEWALRVERPALAESYLRELGVESPSLRHRLDALLAREEDRAAHIAALESLAHDHDLDQGRDFRRRLGVGVGLLFLAVNVGMGWAERTDVHQLGYADMGVTGILMLAVFTPYTWLRRGELFRNRANASLFGICIFTFALTQLHWLSSWQLGLPFAVSLALTPLLYLLAFGALTVLLDWRFVLSPLIQVPTLLLAALFPAWVYEIIGLGGALSAANVGLVWRGARE